MDKLWGIRLQTKACSFYYVKSLVLRLTEAYGGNGNIFRQIYTAEYFNIRKNSGHIVESSISS